MNNSDPRQVLSRLPDVGFSGRTVELARLYSLARPVPAPFSQGGSDTDTDKEQPRPRNASTLLVLGGPRVGKSGLRRTAYDRLFGEGAQTLPFYCSFRASCFDPERFARD